MRKLFVSLLCCLFFMQLNAQQNLKGIVLNDAGTPVEFGTVALLKPVDSTLAYFGITNSSGNFEIKGVAGGKYVLQISFIGYDTYDTLLVVPYPNNGDLGIYILKTATVGLDAVNISAERIPLQIKGDTIEYNAASYKTQPDASAEDLLKKLPGIDVDQSGNIQAQGEDVQKVLVDGKEFFSNDPTVATKNLPADAIEKVQVYDKSSDESEFTGIEDGPQSKTINLILKDGKKSMWLGDVKAGAGTENKYQANAKVYRFTAADQIAFLGMLNNINQFGFSFRDYIDFSGGISSMMQGGGFRIETSDDIPVNFGQSIDGLITNGAAGANYTHEKTPGNRFNMSYLGNGYEKFLENTVHTENYTPDFDYITDENSETTTENYYHRLNFNFKNKPDSMQSIFGTGGLSLSYGKSSGNSFTGTYLSDVISNSLSSVTSSNSNTLSGTAQVSYIHKFSADWKYVKFSANTTISKSLNESEWDNITEYFDPGLLIIDNAFQNETNNDLGLSFDFISLRKIGRSLYLEPALGVGMYNELLQRSRGNLLEGGLPIDSLSPEFTRNNYYIQPKLSLKKNTKKTQFKFGLGAEYLHRENQVFDAAYPQTEHYYLLPELFYEVEIKAGRRFGINYAASVNAPTASQLLPVSDDINPLSVYTGNPLLEPEYVHNLFAHYMLFDQFSFTSLFTRFELTYIQDKINFSKTINPDLTESYTLVNVDNDINSSIGASFNTPIRPLKINVNLDLSEGYNHGINYVNNNENLINAFTHKVGLSFDNRKKDYFDLTIGGSIKYTQTDYSIETGQSGNYITNAIYLDLDVTPDSLWHIKFNGKISEYTVTGFDESTIVPLLSAEISRYILKSNRGTITLSAYDLLDKNKGITQSSAYNYLMQQQTNSIGRYFMLSFKYRINKVEQNDSMEIEIN